jgi:hypothetical protein
MQQGSWATFGCGAVMNMNGCNRQTLMTSLPANHLPREHSRSRNGSICMQVKLMHMIPHASSKHRIETELLIAVHCFSLLPQTDVDCGGPCVAAGRRCQLFSRCSQDADCQSNSCSRSKLTCSCPPGQRLAPDKKRCVGIPTAELAGAFKDVTPIAGSPPPPCALTTVKCGLGDTCRTAADCRSGNCEQQSQRCVCPAGFVAQTNNTGCRPIVINRNDPCWNGVKDNDETDVDW